MGAQMGVYKFRYDRLSVELIGAECLAYLGYVTLHCREIHWATPADDTCA